MLSTNRIKALFLIKYLMKFKALLPRRAILCCFVIHFLVALDALIIVPLSSTISLSLRDDASQAGYLVSAYAIAAAVICLFTKGSLDPNREIKRVYICVVGLAVTTWLTSVASDFDLLIVYRMLSGLFGGALAVLNLNYLTLISCDDDRKRNIAVLLSSFPLALSAGVPALIMLSSMGEWQLSFQVIAGLLLLIGAVVSLSPSIQLKEGSAESEFTDNHKFKLGDYLCSRDLRFAIMLAFSAVLGTFLVSTQFPVMLEVNLGISATLLGYCYAISGTCSFIAMQAFARIRVTEQAVFRLIVCLSLGMVISIVWGFGSRNVGSAAVAFVVFVVVSSTRTLVLSVELINALSVNKRMLLIRLQSSLQHFAVGFGGLLSSALVQPQSGASLDFNTLVYVAVGIVLCTPCLWVAYRKGLGLNDAK
ncbi:MFS transporter [Vibrio lentus]|uniref:MFS transporter n=1 Tax=Vibrio lentus TaxID=136468 RepID=UPI000C816006|nr:MFS transporter [Vibrio lentus]